MCERDRQLTFELITQIQTPSFISSLGFFPESISRRTNIGVFRRLDTTIGSVEISVPMLIYKARHLIHDVVELYS